MKSGKHHKRKLHLFSKPKERDVFMGRRSDAATSARAALATEPLSESYWIHPTRAPRSRTASGSSRVWRRSSGEDQPAAFS